MSDALATAAHPEQQLEPATVPGPTWWRPSLQVPGLLLWALGMVLGWQVHPKGQAPKADLVLLQDMAAHRNHDLVIASRWIEFWDGPQATPYLMLLALVLIFLRGHRLLSILTVLMCALSWFPGHIAKSLFPRERPPASVDPVFHVLGANSYPSGHTGFAVATTVAALFLTSALRMHRARMVCAIVGVLWVLVVGFSRMYIGVHFPTDVLGGALLAGGMSLVIWPIWAGLFALAKKRWPAWTR